MAAWHANYGKGGGKRLPAPRGFKLFRKVEPSPRGLSGPNRVSWVDNIWIYPY